MSQILSEELRKLYYSKADIKIKITKLFEKHSKYNINSSEFKILLEIKKNKFIGVVDKFS